MSSEHRSLLLRANRLLGAALVEHKLVPAETVEAAHERLLQLLATPSKRDPSLLGILAYEMKALREDDLLQHVVDTDGLGLVDLRHYETLDEIKRSLDPGACWATWSVPFDREEDFYFIATAYGLSPAVRSFWEKQFGNQIIWYGTTLDVIGDYLEKLEAERRKGHGLADTRNPFKAPAPRADHVPPQDSAAAPAA